MATASSSNEEIIPEDHGDFSSRKDRWRRGGGSQLPHQIPKDFYVEDMEEKEAVMNEHAEFLEKPRCRGVVEWINCLVFDSLLLIVEAAINFWMATSLAEVGLVSEYRAIIVMLMLPSIINPIIWLVVKNNYKISSAFVFVLLMVGFPSPLFMYLWHLYLSMFASLRESELSKLLSNSFRMVHACVCSMPLLIINLSTLINQLRVDGLEDYTMDIQELKNHMTEVNMHSLAFILSFINFVRGACLFNERETMTLLFGTVALPMTVLTAFCRIILLGIVIAFVEPEWTTILLIGLVVANVLLLWSCKKRTKVIKGYVIQPTSSASHNIEDLNHPPTMPCSNPGSQACLTSCCCNTNAIQSMPTTKSGKYVLTRSPTEAPSQTCWNDMGNYIVMAFASIIVPSGYANDVKMYHPRIKGGLYMILNYLVNMTILGVALGYTILHRVPNEIHGIEIHNPSIGVQVPQSKITVKTGFLDVGIKLPNQEMNLGSMPSVHASVNTDENDRIHAMLFPIILVTICLPFTIMRAAMMELDCFVMRRKQLGEDFDDFLVLEGRQGKKSLANNRRDMWSLRDVLAKNIESKELKCRLYTTLCCSSFGVMIMTMFMMLLGALLYMSM